MTARELIEHCRADERTAQLHISAFIDAFRRGTFAERQRLMEESPVTEGSWEGLVAGVLSALCREFAEPVAPWVALTGSPNPFFAFPARSYAMRMRLMIESPAPFRIRRVFVPQNYLSRA